jgi:hypothetical protein
MLCVDQMDQMNMTFSAEEGGGGTAFNSRRGRFSCWIKTFWCVTVVILTKPGIQFSSESERLMEPVVFKYSGTPVLQIVKCCVLRCFDV